MTALIRIVAINKYRPKVLVPRYAAKRSQGLVEELFSVSDKQQPWFSPKLLYHSGVIKRGDHRFAGASRSDHEVAMLKPSASPSHNASASMAFVRISS